MYTCNKCHLEKPGSDFNNAKHTKSGKAARCRECSNSIRRAKLKGNVDHINAAKKARSDRQALANSYKLKGCSKCGYNKCLAALTFHHIDHTNKIDNIANLCCKLVSLEKIQAEIEKCIVLCQNCHHEVHVEEKTLGLNSKYK